MLPSPFAQGILALSVAAMVSPASAQEYLRIDGHNDFDGFGMSLAIISDIDGDQIDDFVVGAYCTDWLGHNNGGSVTAFSSVTGQQYWMVNGDSGDERLGHCIATLDDLNGDGRVEVLVGAYRDRLGGMRSGSVHVLDGRTGAKLYTVVGKEVGAEFGKSVAVLDDLDGDGLRDWIAGAWLSAANGAESGAAFVHSGADGRQLRSFDGPAGSRYGQSVAAVGDLNGDGLGEFLIGGPQAVDAHGNRSGLADLRSGLDGSRLYVFRGSHNSNFGWSVCGPGDLNGDHTPDVIVGAPGDNTAARSAGAAYSFSGSSGELLHALYGEREDEELGWSVNGAGDYNGDGKQDFIVSAPNHAGRGTETGLLRIHHGVDGSPLRSWLGWSEWDNFGTAVTRAPDVDGDGRDDWLIGAAEAGNHTNFEPGSVALFLDPLRPILRVVKAEAGGQAVLRLTEGTPGHSVRLYASRHGMGMTFATPNLHLDLVNPVLIEVQQVPQSGRVRFEHPVPHQMLGVELWFQAIDWTNKVPSNVVTAVVD